MNKDYEDILKNVMGEEYSNLEREIQKITMLELNEHRDSVEALTAENERLRNALTDVEPYLDAIVCYASTMGEHEGNRIAAAARAALQPKEETQ